MVPNQSSTPKHRGVANQERSVWLDKCGPVGGGVESDRRNCLAERIASSEAGFENVLILQQLLCQLLLDSPLYCE